MELGATVCIPRNPRCGQCPVARFCAAHAEGTEQELPVKLKKAAARDVALDLALFAGRAGNAGKVFLVQEKFRGAPAGGFLGIAGKGYIPKMERTFAGTSDPPDC